jgi:flagellar FliL protein
MAKAKAERAVGNDAEEAEPLPKRGKKPLIFAAAAVLLLLGGGAAVYLSGILGGDDAAEIDASGASKPGRPPVFYPLPEMVVTLSTPDRRPSYLKVRLNLELGDPAEAAKIDPLMPRVTDSCHVFLRTLRPEDLQGSAGTARLRTELLRRIALAVAPVAVNDVLIAELMLN